MLPRCLPQRIAQVFFAGALLGRRDRDASWGVDENSRERADPVLLLFFF